MLTCANVYEFTNFTVWQEAERRFYTRRNRTLQMYHVWKYFLQIKKIKLRNVLTDFLYVETQKVIYKVSKDLYVGWTKTFCMCNDIYNLKLISCPSVDMVQKFKMLFVFGFFPLRIKCVPIVSLVLVLFKTKHWRNVDRYAVWYFMKIVIFKLCPRRLPVKG